MPGRINPSEAIAMGLAHHREGRPEQAEETYRSILETDPDNVNALDLLGWLKHQQGAYAEALTLLEKARGLDKNLAPRIRATRLNLIAGALNALGRSEESLACLKEAVNQDDGFAPGHINMGASFARKGRHDEAIACFERALAIDPESVVALNNLGTSLRAQGKADAAIAAFRKALAIAPNRLEIHVNLGNALRDKGDLPGAIAAFKQALRQSPEHPAVLNELYLVLATACEWDEMSVLETYLDRLLEEALAKDLQPAESPILCAMRVDDPARSLAVARASVKDIAQPAEASPAAPEPDRANRPIVVGYLYDDYRNHPVKHLLRTLCACHDRDAFRLIGYATGHEDGSYLESGVRSGFSQFTDVSRLGPADTAARIRADGIAILVDLNGLSGSALPILAHRAAPIQVSGLAYPGPTGAPFVDYLLTDTVVTPPEEAAELPEAPVYLPLFKLHDPGRLVPPADDRPRWGLPEDEIVWCCFSRPSLIDRETFAVWMDLLSEVPSSVLWLARGNPYARGNLRRAARLAGIAPERLVFAGRVGSKGDHLARLGMADVALDTGRWRDHTAVSDALAAGLPVVARRGRQFATRTSISLLTAAGLPELIADDEPAYRATALALARDPARRQAIRALLRASHQPDAAFDAARFVRCLEAAYRTMWMRHLTGEARSPISVVVPEPGSPALSSRDRPGFAQRTRDASSLSFG